MTQSEVRVNSLELAAWLLMHGFPPSRAERRVDQRLSWFFANTDEVRKRIAEFNAELGNVQLIQNFLRARQELIHQRIDSDGAR